MFVRKSEFKFFKSKIYELEKQLNQLECDHSNVDFGLRNSCYIMRCKDCNKILKRFGRNSTKEYYKEKLKYYESEVEKLKRNIS